MYSGQHITTGTFLIRYYLFSIELALVKQLFLTKFAYLSVEFNTNIITINSVIFHKIKATASLHGFFVAANHTYVLFLSLDVCFGCHICCILPVI